MTFALLMIFSPALRGRMLAKQIRSVRYATDIAKDDISRTGENLAGAAIDTLENVMENRGEQLKDISSAAVRIGTEAITENSGALSALADLAGDAAAKNIGKIAQAVREGGASSQVFCKYCGAPVDSDSVFCKKCGKKL